MYRSIALLALVAAPAFAFVAPIAPMTRMASSRVHMSAKTDAILEELKTLTLMEAAELVKGIEEAFGVDASASGGGMMMAAPVAAAPAEAAEAQTEFDVILDSFPADKKIAVLKVVRTMTGLGLKEAKDLVEAVPKSLKAGVSKAEADDIIKQIEEAGGKCIAK